MPARPVGLCSAPLFSPALTLEELETVMHERGCRFAWEKEFAPSWPWDAAGDGDGARVSPGRGGGQL